jgi:hypothetical protein
MSAVPPCKTNSLAKTHLGVRSSDALDGKILTLDRAAAKKWLVKIIAARAVQLYRQRNRSKDRGSDT